MKLAIYIRSLKTARGAEQVSANVARGLANRDHQIDFLVEDMDGWLIDVLSQHRNISVTDIRSTGANKLINRFFQILVIFRSLVLKRGLASQPDKDWFKQLLRFISKENPPVYELHKYVKSSKPDTILSFLNYPNIALLMSSQIGQKETRYVVNVRNHISTSASRSTSKWVRSVPNLMRLYFPLADNIIAPSSGVSNDIINLLGLSDGSVSVIHNPVYRKEIIERSMEPVDHKWFLDSETPVIVAAGKLKPQKNFKALIKAFALFRADNVARLIIMGEGAERPELEKMARELGVSKDIDMPGYIENPYPYFRNASVFVLSSAWEGLPNVLIEAMACGCPVVATDCPSGPDEILDNGNIGHLVAVSDAEGMARAIEQTIASPSPKEIFINRAKEYSFENSIDGYREVLTGGE
jgi:glycosyltransferase involved in cell wall biosynthesis